MMRTFVCELQSFICLMKPPAKLSQKHLLLLLVAKLTLQNRISSETTQKIQFSEGILGIRKKSLNVTKGKKICESLFTFLQSSVDIPSIWRFFFWQKISKFWFLASHPILWIFAPKIIVRIYKWYFWHENSNIWTK